MEIRFLKPEDAVEWRRLRTEALEQDPEAFSSSLEEHARLSLDDVKTRLGSTGDSFVAGAFEDGQLVGMAGFHREMGPKVRHKGRIWGVYVTHSKRGKGVGRDLMQAILERAAKIEGLDQIQLSVTETQTPALKLYHSLGFKTFGREPGALKIGVRRAPGPLMVIATAVEATLHCKLMPLFAIAWISHVPAYIQPTTAGQWITSFTRHRCAFVLSVWLLVTTIYLADAVRWQFWRLRGMGGSHVSVLRR